MAKPEISITRLYELVEVDTLRGLVFRRGKGLKPAGSRRRDGYFSVVLDGGNYLVHRVVWAFANGEWPPEGFEIDHVNVDRSDNRLSNLRLASRSQNCANRQVCGFYRRSRRFLSSFRRMHLGTFATQAEAQAAYQKAHAEHYGEFSPYYVKAEA